MINVYKADETDFGHNGLTILNPLFCEIKEELNSNYELELKHTFDKNNKWRYLEEGNVIKAPTPAGSQLFRIYKKVKTLNNITVSARHIFYDLVNNFLEDCRPTQQDGSGALNWILNGTQYPHRFIGISDITRVNSATYIRKNPVQVILNNDENSYINRWGGELERDNFTIKMLQNRGIDRGVTIRYGKNLLGLECDINLDTVITRVMPTGLYENDTVLMLPEKYVDSQYINNYPTPKIQHYHFSDIKVGEDLTETQALGLLRQKANELFSIHKIDIPQSNTKVNFIELSKTEEYKNYRILNQIYLADTVTVKHLKLSVDMKAKMISYKYDSIAQRYIEIELGNFKENIGSNFNKVSKTINAVAKELQTNKSDMEKAIENATELLTSAMGGHVLKRNGEILIMDTEDPNTCQKVWRFNLNGLGYSNTGINGQFGIAITMDGKINAEFITAIEVTANNIKGGTLSSLDGSVSINLSDGSFKIGGNGKVAEHGNDYSKYVHSDGSYTRIGVNGLEKYVNGQPKKYKYLTVVGTGTLFFADTSSSYPSVDVTLPDEFKDGDYEVTVDIKDTGNVVPRMYLTRSSVFANKYTYGDLNRFSVMGILTISDPQTNPREFATNVTLEFTYTVIK